ncbi:MAG: transposase [Elusimicrobia bacterium]|nr:transposase [Elusimicrobiota bacterium]
MPRIARFIPENSCFHILSRGNNKQTIFFDGDDFTNFLGFLKTCRDRFLWKIYHYVLMGNHYHLIIYNIMKENLSDGVKLLNLMYVQYFRKRYGGVGHFWQDRFRSFVIQNGKYLLECGRYTELNPVKADLVEKPEDYTWSSYNFYASGKKSRIITPSEEYLGLSDNELTRQKLYREFVYDALKENRRVERYFRRGYYGDEKIGKELKIAGLIERNWKRGPKK